MESKQKRKWIGRRFWRYELPVLLIVALLPEVFVLGASYLWILNSIEHEMSFLAEATARRADNILKITQLNLKQLAEQTDARCDQSSIDFMRDKVFKVMYIRETGIVNNNRLMCNDIKAFEPPVEITNVEQRRIADKDGDIVLVPPMPTLQGGESILVNYRVAADRYVNALIDPDIFAEFHEYVRLGEVSGVFLVREDGKTVVSFGSLPENQLPALVKDEDHIQYHRGNVFSVYQSGSFPVYVVVSASPSFIMKQWHSYALGLLLVSALLSLLLVAVFRRNRRQLCLLQDELWQAIENDEFRLHYQPLMNMSHECCVGAEALLRWQHPERGMIMPMLFIPMAEQTGLIHEITKWIIRRVEIELGEFLQRNPDIHISINLSPTTLGADAYKSLGDNLFNSRIPRHQLIYEITEYTLLPAQNGPVHENMAQLRNKGIKLALDDFGTGYSNLSYLQHFSLDYLKIDKAFVDGIQSETLSTGLIDHVVDIAKTMKYDLIAEGIEHAYQMEYLREHGVTYGQGYYFAKPMAVESFIKFVVETNTGGKVVC